MQNKVSSLTEKEIEEFLNTIDVIDEEGSDDVVSTDDEDIDDGISLVDKFSFGCGELGISVSDLNLTLVTPTASVAREESSVNLHGDSTPPAPPKRLKTCAGDCYQIGSKEPELYAKGSKDPSKFAALTAASTPAAGADVVAEKKEELKKKESESEKDDDMGLGLFD
ncbi:uncharacterized protein LOC128854978 [Anastrepha ludens]|uniref:uncharacterized protein LOC128854978 n=1 Tax=Anastrepha ludens TaxID=28586 RepID=UPI0023B186E6|nr:uncharacterized protein LOC128854978 [Anastrepha ludens]